MIKAARGFTLIELVTGIVVLAIALTLLSTLLFPQARNTVDAIYQIRAVELGNAMLNEIVSKRFDENSDPNGGTPRCGEVSAPSCTAPASLGPDGESRDEFDDVDDYDGLNQIGANIETALGDDLGTIYNGFTVQVSVYYDGNLDSVDDAAVASAKLIRVTVITPDGVDVVFSAYRGNY
ncbi:MAG: type II secretion system protein [Idiomarina sp.]